MVSGSLVVVDAKVISRGGKQVGMVESGIDTGDDDSEERGDKNAGDPLVDRGVG